MIMAADSNMGYHQGVFPSSFYDQHVVSFRSGGGNGGMGVSQEMMNGSGSGGISGAPGMSLAGNFGVIGSSSSPMIAGGSSSKIVHDPVPGLKHDTGLAVEWSFDEMAVLKAGLIKYANEPGMMKYIKIAAMLRDKNVRDVALRCRWMIKESGKRRKIDVHCAGKKIKDRKEKMVDYSSKAGMHPVQPDNMAAYTFMVPHSNLNNQFSSEAPVINGLTWQLMDENIRVLNQITANLAAFKIQENIDLFCQTRNNIVAILNSMNETPGIMSQMPPLPISLNEDLVNVILPVTSQAVLYGSPSGIHLKQEPRS